jgi:CO/xanthine dehydrogenase Mo-binding subunit
MIGQSPNLPPSSSSGLTRGPLSPPALKTSLALTTACQWGCSGADGRFIAMRGSNLVNFGAHAVGFRPLQKGVAIASSIYHIPAVHFRAHGALINTAPTRPCRSAGRPEVMYVMKRLIDLAARETGIERTELRRRNLVPASAMPYRNPFGMVYDSGEYHACMESALRLSDWDGFSARRAEALARGKRRGIGVANCVDTATGVPRERAEVTVLPEGVVEVVIDTTFQGQGHENSFAQLMTEFLGVPLDSSRLALLEQCVYDPNTRQMLSASFMDYAMPRADKFPYFRTEISEVPSPTHPLGIRPGGEWGTTPALGVAINAIVDALAEYGVTHIEIPATPERVWRAINAR